MAGFSISDATSSSNYFAASRFPDEPKTLTIDWVDVVEFKEDGGTSKKKLVVGFIDQDKQLVLNATNGEILKDGFGDDSDNLLGKTIVLYKGQTRFGGKSVPSLMIEVPAEQPELDANTPF